MSIRVELDSSKSGSGRGPVIGMIIFAIVALAGWGYWAYERFGKAEEPVPEAAPAVEQKVAMPEPPAPKVEPPPAPPPAPSPAAAPPEVKESDFLPEVEPPPEKPKKENKQKKPGKRRKPGKKPAEPEMAPPEVKESEPPPAAAPPEAKEPDVIAKVEQQPEVMPPPEPPPKVEPPPEVEESPPESEGPPAEVKEPAVEVKEPDVVAQVEPPMEPPEAPPVEEPKVEPAPEPPPKAEPPPPSSATDSGILNALAEFEGLRASRVDWNEELSGIAKGMSSGILIRELSMKQELGTGDEGAPARIYTLVIKGKAKSDDSVRTINEFRDLLAGRDRIATAEVMGEVKKGAAGTVIFEQPFAVECKYKPQALSSIARTEKGDVPDVKKAKEDVLKLSRKYVMPAAKSPRMKALAKLIKTEARQAGVLVREARGTGISSLGEGDRWIKAYGALLGATCSFGETVRLLREIEERNPYLAVSSFDVSAEGAKRGNVETQVALQIPIWSDPVRVRNALGEVPAIGTKPPKPKAKPKPEPKAKKPETKPQPKPKPKPRPQPKPKPAVAKPSGPPSWPKLALKGITKGADGKLIAMIEGVGPVTEGEELMALKGGYIFSWRIDSISADGSLKFTKLGMKKKD